ncbi:MAG: alpha/beta fold hydrolase [Propionibacteriaceae bacterium]
MKSLFDRALKPRSASLSDAPEPAPVIPGAEAYHGGDGRVGVLLIHGFTGSPVSMRAWAEHLEADGFRVAVPRLPGHGTAWQDLVLTEWPDWYAVVDEEFRRLRDSCDQVFLCGLSMGGTLALLLAERRGAEIAGVVLVNAIVTTNDKRALAVPVLRAFVPTLEGISNDIAKPGVEEGGYDRTPLKPFHSMTKMWREVREHLDRVDQPLLIFRSVEDHVVDPSSGQAILAAVSSSDVHEHLLQRSYHVATMDYESDDIFAGSTAFFRRLTKD